MQRILKTISYIAIFLVGIAIFTYGAANIFGDLVGYSPQSYQPNDTNSHYPQQDAPQIILETPPWEEGTTPQATTQEETSNQTEEATEDSTQTTTESQPQPDLEPIIVPQLQQPTITDQPQPQAPPTMPESPQNSTITEDNITQPTIENFEEINNLTPPVIIY